jgi:FixJ family two-component response regulator
LALSDTPIIPIIAVIDADESLRFALAKLLRSSDCAVELFASAEEFLGSKRIGATACLIIDANMPGMGGLELQSHLASAGRHIPIIFITASSLDKTARARALAVGAIDFLRKPSGEGTLLNEIRFALRVRNGDKPLCDSQLGSGMSETFPISIVDDDESVRRSLERLIRSFGFPVVAFPSAHEFLLSTHVRDTACLVLDMQMPRMNGLQLQSHLAQAGSQIPIIFITAYPDERQRTRALQAGAVDLLEKPFRDDVLLDRIRRALRIGTVEKLPR